LELDAIYKERFQGHEVRRAAIWRVLVVNYFAKLIPSLEKSHVLDMGSGYGEFINQIHAARRSAVDLNPDSRSHLDESVQFVHASAEKLRDHFPSDSVDAIFTSNFFEHLPDKESLSRVVEASFSVLRPGGVLICMGPNIRYLAGKYWDFIDHYIPLSEKSLAELLMSKGFEIKKVIPKFLPYTMSDKQPPNHNFVKVYLRFPLIWKLMGKQFLVVATKPDSGMLV